MNRNYLIVIGLGLATVAAFLLINYFSQNAPQSVAPEETVTALEIEIQDLENSILELELIDEENRRDVSRMQTILNEKNDELRLLEDQIKKLEEDGQADDEMIDQLKARLSEARAGLLEQYQDEINVLVVDVAGLTRRFDSIVGVNRRTDSAYYNLQRKSNDIDKLYRECMEANNQSIPAAPSVPRINANITSIVTEGGKDQTTTKSKFGTFQLESNDFQTLKVCFSLKGNELVESGKKTLYLVLTPEQGRPLTNSSLYGSVPINFADNTTGVASRRNDVDYIKGGSMSPCLEFELGKKFPTGVCKVELVYDGERIASERLFVR